MKNITRLRRYGFLKRMSTSKGRLTINNRRAHGRKRLSV